jgi:hypothetical protein
MGELPQLRPVLRFSLAGIPVQVQLYFALMLLVSASSRDLATGAIWCAVVTASVLWHELGHALVMRWFGDEPWIELHGMGGAAHWPAGAAPSPGEALLVTVAGPGAGLLLGGAIWALARAAPPRPFLAMVALRDALYVNIGWSLFNLLPLLPLDGAGVLDHLSQLCGSRREPRWVGWVSAATGAAVALWAALGHSPYLALIGALGTLYGVARLRGGGRTVARGRRSLEAARRAARRARSRGDLAGVARALLPEARLGALPEGDLAQLVGALVRVGREADLVALCRERLCAFARKDDAEPLTRLAAEALAEDGALEDALAVAQSAFRQLRVAHQAYDAACLLVQLEQPEEAVRWLVHAVEAGLDCGAMLRDDPALAPLRQRPDFLAVAERAGERPATG